MFSERSGVVNIALEGIMMIGAFSAATSVYFLEQYMGVAPWVALLFGIAAGMLASLIHAFLSIDLSSNQVISGTAINLLAGGVTIYLSQIIFDQQRTLPFAAGFVKTTYGKLADIPFIGNIFFTNMYPTVFLALALVVVSWYILYKTPCDIKR